MINIELTNNMSNNYVFNIEKEIYIYIYIYIFISNRLLQIYILV